MTLVDRVLADVVDHGGSLGRARALFPHAPEPWVDLSTGINPHSYPLFELPATALSRLPEPSRLRELLAVAASAYRAPDIVNVAAAPGTQILLPRVASLLSPGRALVLGPTYAEHGRAAVIAGHRVEEVTAFEALTEADLAIVVNPNNPDGRVVTRSKLLDLAEIMRGKGGLLVVDEAFMDVGPQAESVAGDVGAGGLVVLRSFGKFFGLAGVRLGFALCHEAIATKLEAGLGPWAVAGPALEYGIRALGDQAWQDRMRGRLADEAGSLDLLFAKHGVAVSGGTNLFRHIVMDDADRLFSVLGERGIILRNFAERPGTLRAGLPNGRSEFERLEESLKVWSYGRDLSEVSP